MSATLDLFGNTKIETPKTEGIKYAGSKYFIQNFSFQSNKFLKYFIINIIQPFSEFLKKLPLV